jgi:hypothetical protein
MDLQLEVEGAIVGGEEQEEEMECVWRRMKMEVRIMGESRCFSTAGGARDGGGLAIPMFGAELLPAGPAS